MNGVRGSPLVQCLMLLVLLGLAALGFRTVTRERAPTPAAHDHAHDHAGHAHDHGTEQEESLEVPYFLSLSAPAKRVVLSTSYDGTTEVPLQGKLAWAPQQPIFLTVEWSLPPAPGERRFAKLTLEPPRLPTLTHFFDAAGNIEAVWEP